VDKKASIDLSNVELVTWIDSMSSSDWTPVEDVSEKLRTTQSVGFLIEETEEYIVLALSIDEQTRSINCWQYIPRVAIKKRYTLDMED
jgi:hypothetical protein